MTRGRCWIIAVAVVALAGCGGPGGTLPPGAEPDPGRVDKQARDALARWDTAVDAANGRQAFVPVAGSMTGMVGDWEESAGANNKVALAAGQLLVARPLPATAPPTAKVRWQNGTTITVKTITAAKAVERVRAEGVGGCDGCTPLSVTGARLTTAQVQTSRGPATAPAWEFTLSGTSVRVTHVAVADAERVTVTPPEWDPYDAPGGLAIERATVDASGQRLTVTFTGAPGTGDKPCGADYTGRAVESMRAVVVIVDERRHADDETCTAIGAVRTATVDLASPLGDRAVLEVMQGLPVPVTKAS